MTKNDDADKLGWWCLPVIPVLWKQSQGACLELEASRKLHSKILSQNQNSNTQTQTHLYTSSHCNTIPYTKF